MTVLLEKKRCWRFVLSIWISLVPCVLASATVLPGGSDEAQEAESTAQVQIWLDDWRSDLPPGVSLIVKSGGLVNNSFPAVSADRSRIAVCLFCRSSARRWLSDAGHLFGSVSYAAGADRVRTSPRSRGGARAWRSQNAGRD